jgi:hypothetical protein
MSRTPPFDAQTIDNYLQHFASKRAHAGTFFDVSTEGVSLAWLLRNAPTYTELVSRALNERTHRFAPGELRVQRIGTKDRELAAFQITDVLLHYCASRLIEMISERELSPHVYSYVRGRSYIDAVRKLAAFLRAYASRRAPNERHLYVVQRDIGAYYDSIPVLPRAPMWGKLKRLVDASSFSSEDKKTSIWLLRQTLRPKLTRPDGSVFTPILGLTTGSPVSPPMSNVYLSEMDHDLGTIEGGFYARYGDDFLFVHEDPAEARRAIGIAESITGSLGLVLHERKIRNTYLTACGKAAPAPDFTGGAHVDFLGFSVSARGAIGLRATRVQTLLRDLRGRARRTVRFLPEEEVEARGRAACAVINDALSPASGVAARAAVPLRRLVTDRRQLEHLDRLIALIVVRCASGAFGARGFREVPYRRIRSEWGLTSLAHARNAEK